MKLVIPQHPLFVVQDIIQLPVLQEGYLLVYEGGLTLNEQPYDLPVFHVTKPFEIPDFYPVPLRTCRKEEKRFFALTKELRQQGYARQLIRFPDLDMPCLYDAVKLGEKKIVLSSHAYNVTTLEELLRKGEAGERIAGQVDRLVSICKEQLEEAAEEVTLSAPSPYGRN